MTNFKVFTESFSIFTCICAKFHDLIPSLGKYCLFQKSKFATRDVIIYGNKVDYRSLDKANAELIVLILMDIRAQHS